MKKLVRLFLSLFVFIVIGFPAAQSEEVDLELVLAMDASGSISDAEYLLQLGGTAAAFLDPGIQAAITSGPTGKIAVTVVLWSDAAFPKINSGWFLLSDKKSIEEFAAVVSKFQLSEDNKIAIGGGGGTGIGAGVVEGLKLIRENRFQGLRKVIDVSGDGIETEFWFKTKSVKMPQAKSLAGLQSVKINGLPILSPNFPALDAYYLENVIHGPGAFIVVANGFDDFRRAIREKLWREIAQSVSYNQNILPPTKFALRNRPIYGLTSANKNH